MENLLHLFHLGPAKEQHERKEKFYYNSHKLNPQTY